MAERFSQKNLRVRPSSDEEKIVTNAKKHFEKTLVEISGELVGSVAALEHPTKNKKLNPSLNTLTFTEGIIAAFIDIIPT